MTAEERGVGNEDIVDASWDPTWGDRMQELVFIGIGMEEEKMRGGNPCPFSVMRLMAIESQHSSPALTLADLAQ